MPDNRTTGRVCGSKWQMRGGPAAAGASGIMEAICLFLFV
jgi:hypothetical protein